MAGARDKILDAAEDVLLGEGAVNLTLERVAAVAGVSKGGLLYHFRSKQALVAGMVERLMRHFTVDYEALEDAEPGAVTRAFLLGSTDSPASGAGRRHERLAAAVLAAATLDPELLAPIREYYARLQRRIEADGIDPARATLVRLAADGWFYSRLLGFPLPSDELAEEVREVLSAMTRARPA
ncbi:TetR/AcrR family transcriptional regulator [Streptomyces fuscichromogenes]|uniref:TetR/AcrR family transcriptional regulator n=1 Tax=Streptomyces fuscichromogenes TaxID=1324013 RepID=UPI0037FCB0F2